MKYYVFWSQGSYRGNIEFETEAEMIAWVRVQGKDLALIKVIHGMEYTIDAFSER